MKASLVVVVCLFLAFTSCQRSDESQARAAAETIQDNNPALDQERDQYVDAMQARADELGKKIDGLEERAEAMNGSAKERLNMDIQLLRDQRQMVLDKLKYVDGVEPESWTKLKTYVDSDFMQLEGSYENISTRRDFR
jgi:TolA-binding protein